jgi:DNA-binding NarL/FixJ family response regulator
MRFIRNFPSLFYPFTMNWSMPAERFEQGQSATSINRRLRQRCLQPLNACLGGEIYLSEKVTSQITAQFAGRLKGQGASLEGLTDRELQVIELIGDGLGTRQVAELLHLDISTIETYRARAKEKLGLKDAQELLQYAIRWNRRHAY